MKTNFKDAIGTYNLGPHLKTPGTGRKWLLEPGSPHRTPGSGRKRLSGLIYKSKPGTGPRGI